MAGALPRPVATADIFRVRWLDDPQLSADGARIAFTVSGLDRERDALSSSVYVCHAEPPAATHGLETQADHVGHPTSIRGAAQDNLSTSTVRSIGPEGMQSRAARWSPDSKQLSLVCGAAGGEQLWMAAAEGSNVRQLTHGPAVAESCWSPDGKQIAFAAVADGRRALWTVGIDGADPACISDGSADDTSPRWSPDGRTIAFLSRRDSPFADIWLTTPTGGPFRRLTPGSGPVRALAWSPDSRWIAYIGHARGHAQGVNFGLYVCAADGSTSHRLCPQLDRSIGQVVRSDDLRGMEPPSLGWSADGERIFFAYADGGVSHIGWAALNGDHGIAVDGRRACLSFSSASQADCIAFVASDALNPGEIFTARGDGQCERRVTGINDAWLDEVALSQPERLRIECDDGAQVEGWLLHPPGWSAEQRYPLILQIHGGPHYPLGERFYFDFQRLAALGYIVLYCNARGSQGYGEAFATQIRGAWGERDYRDLMQALDVAAALPAVDAKRTAVTGVSYGGFMTNWMIGHTQRFRAAICENGISNLTTNFVSSIHGSEFWEWELCGTPATEPERYRALSPISYAEQIRTPLLLIHAEQDENCAIAQSEALCAALQALDRSVSLVRIPGEGHLMNLVGRPSARLARMAAIDGWLTRWV